MEFMGKCMEFMGKCMKSCMTRIFCQSRVQFSRKIIQAFFDFSKKQNVKFKTASLSNRVLGGLSLTICAEKSKQNRKNREKKSNFSNRIIGPEKPCLAAREYVSGVLDSIKGMDFDARRK